MARGNRSFVVLVLILLALCCRPAAAFAGCPALTLVFNATSGEWSVLEAGCRSLADFDENGRPKLFIGKTVKVSVRIVEVNPLIYTAAYGDVTVEDIASLKELQALALVGGNLIGAGINPAAADLSVTENRNAELERAVRAAAAAVKVLDQERGDIVRAAQTLEFAPEVTVRAPSRPYADWWPLYRELQAQYDREIENRDAAEAAINAGRLKIEDAEIASDAVLKQAETLLKSASDIMKSAATLHLAMKPLCGRQACAPGQSVTMTRIIVMPDIVRAARWDKVATYPIKIARNGLLADQLATRMPKEVATSLKIASPTASLLGVDVGLMTASYGSATYAAVVDPANPAQKRVTRTDDGRFTAVPALIGTYAFTQANARRPIRVLAEFGGSVKTDKPAWLVGPGVSFGGVLRVGAGLSAGRIKVLDGQQDGVTVVESKDAIKTKGAWTKGWYWSFGVTIAPVHFFKQ